MAMETPGSSEEALSPDDILARMKVEDDEKFPNVYVLGCQQRPLTFHSQQHRAFNLIWALMSRGKLAPKQRLGIVGGGLAGMTAAAAAMSKGVYVKLIEQHSEGQCCNLERAGTGRARYGTASSRNLEQSCNEIETALNLSDPY